MPWKVDFQSTQKAIQDLEVSFKHTVNFPL